MNKRFVVIAYIIHSNYLKYPLNVQHSVDVSISLIYPQGLGDHLLKDLPS